MKKIAALVALALIAVATSLVGSSAHRANAASGPGQFIIACPPSHTRAADPIVSPGFFPSAHEHQFFANNSTDENSTVASMEAASTTCKDQGDTAGYWEPTLCRRQPGEIFPTTRCQEVIRPITMFAYYHGKASTVKLPEGLKMVAGGLQDPSRTFWDCFKTGGHSSTPLACTGSGNYLVVRIRFPDCFKSGVLDSPDHRSHMAYDKKGVCPAGFVLGPDINFFTRFPANLDPSGLVFSDGTTIEHADFFQTWRQSEFDRLMSVCINAQITCGQVTG